MKHFLIAVLVLAASTTAAALDHVVFQADGNQQQGSGKVLVEDQQGGVLLLSRDGGLRSIEKKDLVRRSSDERPFSPLTQDEMAKHVLSKLPRGFHSHKTANYVIVHNTSTAYAAWCGGLFERLHRSFFNFWSRKGIELKKPDFPLAAIVFADRESYQQYARRELGEAAAATIGLYSLHNNRMTMFDVTQLDKIRRGRRGRLTSREINAMLSRPEGERTVATIVHEATHQMAFNCGLHTRYSDVPLWVSEGVAVYFETPDLKSRTGWTTIGKVNRVKLAAFRRYLPRRGKNSLMSLIVNDDRFRSAKTAGDAYAEAWALVYQLMKGRDTQKQFLAYLKMLAAKRQLRWDKPEDRLRQFQEHFGDIGKLDADFVRDMRRVR